MQDNSVTISRLLLSTIAFSRGEFHPAGRSFIQPCLPSIFFQRSKRSDLCSVKCQDIVQQIPASPVLASVALKKEQSVTEFWVIEHDLEINDAGGTLMLHRGSLSEADQRLAFFPVHHLHPFQNRMLTVGSALPPDLSSRTPCP